MNNPTQIKSALNRKFEKVREVPANFDFYVSIHDFIEFIESTPSFRIFLGGEKAKRAAELPKKYFSLREIYQGIEDLDRKTTEDLGHSRYVAIRELGLIRSNDFSENNSFWKRRELFRKIIGETYRTLDAHLS